MIVVRCLSGALNGNVAVIKAAIGDITDETNSTDAFALYGLTWTVGSIVGYVLTGSTPELSEPDISVTLWADTYHIHTNSSHPSLAMSISSGPTLTSYRA